MLPQYLFPPRKVLPITTLSLGLQACGMCIDSGCSIRGRLTFNKEARGRTKMQRQQRGFGRAKWFCPA